MRNLFFALLFFSTMSANALESDPPILESFTVAPTKVNVYSSIDYRIVTFTVEASDESQIDWALSEIKLKGPTETFALPLSTSSPHTASFGSFAPSLDYYGLWRTNVRLVDEHGNSQNYDDVGQFYVYAASESDPPILESFTVAPNEVNVSTEAQIVTFTVEASDESQIDWAISEIALESPSNVVHILPLSSTSPHTASFEIGCDSAQGLWRVRHVGLFDEHRNYKEYDANELTETEITVEFIDTDLDSIDDCYDSDDDNDGVEDSEDEFPLDASESVDTDGDGIGNNSDEDDDGDGYSDSDESSAGTDPLDANSYPEPSEEEASGLPMWLYHVVNDLLSGNIKEVRRLEREGWDMKNCQRLPSSSYDVGNEEQKIDVSFVNDTGAMLKPAYVDLRGSVRFLTERAEGITWDDRTYFGTNWVWFQSPNKCLGLSASKFEWQSEPQRVSEIAEPSTIR
jgi:hypothetical protein